MGSGSLAAMGVFEDGFKPDMTKEEGCKLVRDAIAAGIFNDLGSGSNIDLCVITADGVDYMRPCVFLLARAVHIYTQLPPAASAVCSAPNIGVTQTHGRHRTMFSGVPGLGSSSRTRRASGQTSTRTSPVRPRCSTLKLKSLPQTSSRSMVVLPPPLPWTSRCLRAFDFPPRHTCTHFTYSCPEMI